MSVEVTGAREAAAAYRAIAADARDMSAAHRRIADAGAQAASSRAPVRTGALAGSIEASSGPREATLAVGVPYWPATEFGTRYVRARRYLGAGIEAMRSTAPDAYRAALAADIARRT